MANRKSRKQVFHRIPVICAAGKRHNGSGDRVETLLKYYPDVDMAEALIKAQEDPPREYYIPPEPPIVCTDSVGEVFNEVTNKTRFMTFLDDFYENLYFKKCPVGQVNPYVKSKPAHVTNDSMTFGRPYPPQDSAYDVVLPNKKPEKVLRDYYAWHDKYVFSHSDYFPSEQIKRNYDPKYFNYNQTQGKRVNADFSGKDVKEILQNPHYGSKNATINNTLDQFLKTHRAPFGQPLKRQGFQFDNSHTFGKPQNTDTYTVKEIIQNVEPCEAARKLFESLGYIRRCRIYYFKKKYFHFQDILRALKAKDTDHSGYMEYSKLFKLLRRFYVQLDEDKVRFISDYLGYSKGNKVHFINMVRLLMYRYPMPPIGKIFGSSTEKGDDTYTSTYRVMTTDGINKPLNCDILPAGRQDSQYPRRFDFIGDTENLGEETTAKHLISPSIMMHFGLSHRDFLKPRTKIDIRNIFHNAGVVLSNEKFDELWDEAKKEWSCTDELVSVEAFKATVIQANILNL